MTDKQIIKKFSDNHCLVLENNQISLREDEITAYQIVLGKSTNELLEFVKDTYLQLARKKQEYEELRQYHNKCCGEFENEKQNLIDKYNQFSKDFFIGKYCKKEYCDLLKAKEQECEELKKQVKKYGEINEQETKDYAELKAENDLFRTCHDNEQEKRRKYEQTLIEIKEIAEKQCNICEALTPIDEYKDCKKCWQGVILQKISEVGNERN